jgi:hypothetical protein
MFQKLLLLIIILFLASISSASTGDKVFFISPKDGATVSQALQLKFGEKGLNVVPAGKDIDNKKDGHFHVLIDEDFVPEGKIIPTDGTHIHYGKAQKSGEIIIAPGPHKLTLQFADGAHRSYGKNLSQTINVIVE